MEAVQSLIIPQPVKSLLNVVSQVCGVYNEHLHEVKLGCPTEYSEGQGK